MAKDKQGNDLANVGVPVTGAICIVPYAEGNVITRTMIGKKNATPKLPEVYARGTSCLGLLASDGAPQDSTESGDAIDAARTAYLASLGLHVLRIPNNALPQNFPATCDHLCAVIKK